MASLKRYRDKRDPGRTPEPVGEDRNRRTVPPGAPRVFVVQQHAARNMHWDLRLEIDDVLVSWAVPKGPSLDPREKRLAVRTEDHPLEYADFEGVIPEGNYGAGAMVLWDRGSWWSVDGKAPSAALEAGKIDLFFDGHVMRGRFALVRTKGEGDKHWLLIRKGDQPEDGAPELVEQHRESVVSGLTIEDLEAGVRKDDELAELAREVGGVKRELRIADLEPMLAEPVRQPFSDEDWVFELKFDGVRALAQRSGERVELRSRRGKDMRDVFPELVLALGHLPCDDFILDGEIIANDERGRSTFALLQKRINRVDAWQLERAPMEVPVRLQAFDLLSVGGLDLRGCELTERKAVLQRLVPEAGYVRYTDHVEGAGERLFEMAKENGLEGVIGKRADSRYVTGRRTSDWCKFKSEKTGTFAIVGYIEGRGARKELGAIIVAWHDGDGLVHAANVGSGLTDETIATLLRRFRRTRRKTPGFSNAPDPPEKGTTYVRPELACEVRHVGVTPAGLLRQPIFLGLRDDAEVDHAPVDRDEVADVVRVPRKKPQRLNLTNLDKVFWPEEGYTKGDLLAYYEAAWPFVEPYLVDRPVVLTRYPDGIDGKWFFQHDAPDWTPDWVVTERIEDTDYFICNDPRTLLHVINSGAIPLHAWSSRRGTLDRPDWVVLDLDPKDAPFTDVVRIAKWFHALLEELGVPHFAKTSGQAGLHLLLPLDGTLDHDQARSLGEVLARAAVAELGDVATVARPIAARGEKVYVDYLQNGDGKTVVAPLSVRPKPGAPVSMPLRWSQVTSRLDPSRWTIRTALRELEKNGDPLDGLMDASVDVAALLEGVQQRLA